jgi:hypothetical protein
MKLPIQTTPPQWDRLLSIADSGISLMALMDACEEPEVQEKVPELGDRAQSLFQGPTQQKMSAIAPYLVQIDRPVLQWIRNHLADRPWGYFLLPNTPHQLSSIRKHFRRFLLVDSPEGQELYFRFYDPRVIVGFLECCSIEERQLLMSPLKEILVPNSDGWLQLVAPNAEGSPSMAPLTTRFQMTPKHFESLQKQQMDHFVDQTIQRWQANNPDSCAMLAAENHPLEQIIREAIDDAESYGVTGEADVELYLDCICLLGVHFNRNKQFAWVHEILQQESIDGTGKIDQIHDRLVQDGILRESASN